MGQSIQAIDQGVNQETNFETLKTTPFETG
jgi:hypothetical protein